MRRWTYKARAAACLLLALLAGLLLTVWYRAGILRVRRVPAREFSECPYSVLFSLDQAEYREDGSCLVTARAMAEDALFPFENYASAERGTAMLFSTQLGVLQGDEVCIFPSRAFVPDPPGPADETGQRMEQALARTDWTNNRRDSVATYGLCVLVPAQYAGQDLPLVLIMRFPEGDCLIPLEETV